MMMALVLRIFVTVVSWTDANKARQPITAVQHGKRWRTVEFPLLVGREGLVDDAEFVLEVWRWH